MFKFDALMIVWCVIAICAAVAYAQFDEEFADMIGWISRDFHYANGVQIGCAAYLCENLTWTPGIGRDSQNAGLRVSAEGVEIGSSDFSSAAALAAAGWTLEMQNDEQGRVWMKRQLPGYGWMQAEFAHGALAQVFVRSETPLTVAVEGRTIPLPLDRREMKRTFPAPVKVVRHNAVNGTLPD